jgi:hypothetical protein
MVSVTLPAAKPDWVPQQADEIGDFRFRVGFNSKTIGSTNSIAKASRINPGG